ncbi:MAG: hypothetical protein AUJ37_03040 [Candidatus Magasanikbacteria bacterium CG1_02_41_34]|nr:MAG: hypothetical protein AUJ37_03040 [Candidatus Magasanikbacteria bacterium CG1_02_41_34]
MIMWIKTARSKMMQDLAYDLQRSIDFVNQTLERDYSIDPTSRLEAPKELFEHYLFVVSNNWKALAEMRP